MSFALGFFTDTGLTVPLTQLDVVLADDGSSGAQDRVIYVGSAVAGKQFMVESDPGVAQIVLSVTDAAGGGLPSAAVRLALSSPGLDTATPGASINIGPVIDSGVGNAVPVFMRINVGVVAAGTYSDLSLTTSPLVQVLSGGV